MTLSIELITHSWNDELKLIELFCHWSQTTHDGWMTSQLDEECIISHKVPNGWMT